MFVFQEKKNKNECFIFFPAKIQLQYEESRV